MSVAGTHRYEHSAGSAEWTGCGLGKRRSGRSAGVDASGLCGLEEGVW